MKKSIFPLILLFSSFYSPLSARSCNSSSDVSIDRPVSDDCGECSQKVICSPRTFIRPRSITTDLTYRNAMSFYQRFNGAREASFTYDTSFIFQKSRNGVDLGRGFFGRNPFLIAEQGGDINALNLGLISAQPEGFTSRVRISPKRRVFAWLNQFIWNFDPIMDGLWADIAFAVVKAHHFVDIHEDLLTPGDIPGLRTVSDALSQLGVFPTASRSTAVDDVEIRFGYDYSRCGLNSLGFYIVGSQATGPHYDNSLLFQPIVGSRHSGIGAGIRAFYTLPCDFTLMTELKYQFKFHKCERRIFDLTAGPLSRFVLVNQQNERGTPVSASALLRHKVVVDPGSTLDWWLAAHYQRCKWGFEGAYNLFWRQSEKIHATPFTFGNFGIFDKSPCLGLTSNSTGLLTDTFGPEIPDSTFVRLTTDQVNFCSATSKSALSHTFSGTLTYEDYFKGCYPWMIAFGSRYELASKSKERKGSTLENWGFFINASLSM